MEKCKIVKNVKIRVFHENPCFHQNSWKCHRETWYFRKWHFRQKSLFFWFFLVKNHVKTPYVLARCWRVLSDRVEKPGFSVIFRDFRWFSGIFGVSGVFRDFCCTTVGSAVLQWERLYYSGKCSVRGGAGPVPRWGTRARTTRAPPYPGTPPTDPPTSMLAGLAVPAVSQQLWRVHQASFGYNRLPNIPLLVKTGNP